MKPKSNNLFHFTKNITAVNSILKNGFFPRYCLEDIRYLGKEHDYLAYPMVCFCDIPISRIGEHTAFYGEYGLGLTKEWGLRNGLLPAIYTPPTGRIAEHLDWLLAGGSEKIQEDNEPEKKLREQMGDHFFEIVPLVKQTSGKMLVGGSVIEKDFHQENEWRHVPKGSYPLFNVADYEQKRQEKNKELESFPLSVTPTDIKYIFVKSDHEIPDLVDFINGNLSSFSLREIKILCSRIVSLETIMTDV